MPHRVLDEWLEDEARHLRVLEILIDSYLDPQAVGKPDSLDLEITLNELQLR